MIETRPHPSAAAGAAEAHETAPDQPASQPPQKLPKTIVLVGLMGAGKSYIGRRLAQHFAIPFVDADDEIEKAAGCTIPDIFERHGEPYFRAGEQRVIARLLDGPIHVLATGGGAFMDARTRAKVRERGISIWLRADIELLLRRVARRNNRPLLNNNDRRATLEKLIAERYPIYAEADIVVDSMEGPPDATSERARIELERYLTERAPAADAAVRVTS